MADTTAQTQATAPSTASAFALNKTTIGGICTVLGAVAKIGLDFSQGINPVSDIIALSGLFGGTFAITLRAAIQKVLNELADVKKLFSKI